MTENAVAPADPPVTPVDRAFDSIEEDFGVISNRVRQEWSHAAAAIHPELQPMGYKILVHLVRHGGTNAHALVRHFQTDKSVVSRQIRMLEAAGLITAEPDPSDKRSRTLTVADDTAQRVRDQLSQRRRRLRLILHNQPEAEVLALAALMRRLGRDHDPRPDRTPIA
jgi:DNA-binding MarR family transcriptional regulator